MLAEESHAVGDGETNHVGAVEPIDAGHSQTDYRVGNRHDAVGTSVATDGDRVVIIGPVRVLGLHGSGQRHQPQGQHPHGRSSAPKGTDPEERGHEQFAGDVHSAFKTRRSYAFMAPNKNRSRLQRTASYPPGSSPT